MIIDRIGRPVAANTKRRQFSDFLPSVVSNSAASGVTVAPNATAHTKGSWVEIIASTVADADFIQLLVSDTFAVNNNGGALMDVGVGAASSEVVVAANVACGSYAGSNSFDGSPSNALPIRIPRGSRVAVRWQSVRASAGSAKVAMVLYRWPPELGIQSPTTLDTIGADTATTKGVSAGLTSGTWVEMSAAASQAYQGFSVGMMSNYAAAANSYNIRIEVGVGASGSERAAAAGTMWYSKSSEYYTPSATGFPSGYIPIRCPKGARIAARVYDTSISSNREEIVLLGVPYA